MGWWLPSTPLSRWPIQTALQAGIHQKNVPGDAVMCSSELIFLRTDWHFFYQCQKWGDFFHSIDLCEICTPEKRFSLVSINTFKLFVKRGMRSLQRYLECVATGEGKKEEKQNYRGNDANPSLKWFLSASLFHLLRLRRQDLMWSLNVLCYICASGPSDRWAPTGVPIPWVNTASENFPCGCNYCKSARARGIQEGDVSAKKWFWP